MPNHTILIVDADSSNRALVKAALRKEGHQTLEASNGLQALVLAVNHHCPIDLLVADATLPGIDGAGLIEKFRQGFPATPAALLAKPFEADSLLRTVRELLAARPAPRKQPGNASVPFRGAEVEDRPASRSTR